MSVSVDLITCVEELSHDDINAWNALAANPFQRWEWLGSWWRTYQGGHSLHVLSVKRNGEVIAFAPWYIENRITTGRTVQFLGSGKACTDHLSLLVQPPDRQEACDAIASWLATANTMNRNELPRQLVWDAIELIGVDFDDQPMNILVQSMKDRGLAVKQTEGMGSYFIDLPTDWEDYVKLRSKSGRREIRQSQQNIDDGSIVLKQVRTQQQLDEAWGDFVTLHQRRRHASGTSGCFDHPPFGDFLRSAASELLRAGFLQFVIANADDRPVAAQFAIADHETWYFYQSGMEPDASGLRPGLSMFCHSIRSTIETGRKRFDMMRGDESYKRRWRAELRPAQEIRVCSPSSSAQLRNHAYAVGVAFKNLAKSSLGISQTR